MIPRMQIPKEHVDQCKFNSRARGTGCDWATLADELKLRVLRYLMNHPGSKPLGTVIEIAASLNLEVADMLSAPTVEPADETSEAFAELFLEGVAEVLRHRLPENVGSP